jgi:hypothetical protein
VLGAVAWARRLLRLVDLDQVPAGVGEDRHGDRAGVGRLHRERDAVLLQPLEFCMDVVDLERGQRNALAEQLLLVRLRGRVRVRLERELDVGRTTACFRSG